MGFVHKQYKRRYACLEMFRAASGIVLQSALLGVDAYIGIEWVFLMTLFVCFVHHHKRGDGLLECFPSAQLHLASS